AAAAVVALPASLAAAGSAAFAIAATPTSTTGARRRIDRTRMDDLPRCRSADCGGRARASTRRDLDVSAQAARLSDLQGCSQRRVVQGALDRVSQGLVHHGPNLVRRAED